jgi:hypothetical protein
MSTSEILRRDRERRDSKREEREKRRGRKLLRLPEARKRLAVGKTKFDEDFIKTGRLRLLRIGPKCVAVVEDELDALIDEIVAERDASPSPQKTTA